MGWNWVASATSRKGLTALAGAIALAAAVMPTTASSQTLTGIAATKHNLRSDGAGVNKFTADSGSTEICVFCHTPHGADTNAAVPLWNRVLPAASSFTTYDQLKTSTLDGNIVAVGSVSLACLSCHDGATAMNTVINAPGSGNYNTAGFTIAGTWVGGSQSAGKLTGAVNNGISLIGKVLKDDHPIGIQYAGGGYYATGTTPSGVQADQGDPDFVVPKNKVLNDSVVWWVETGADASGRQKTDMILYTRSDSTAGTNAGKAQPYVECASCHDPHTENTTFLRIANTGSAVCLACHIK